jgi:hypothetical protein
MWKKWPHAMAAVLTGCKSGLVVTDADNRAAEGKDGLGHAAAMSR